MATPPQKHDETGRELKLFMTADSVGGVFAYALDLARGLAPHGVSTTLALLGPSPTPAQRAEAGTVPNLRLVDTHLPLDWLAEDRRAADQAAEEVATLAAYYGADIIHLNTPSLACDDYRRPVVTALHSCVASWWQAVRSGPMPADFRWRTQVTAHGLHCADALVCPSAALAAEVERIYGRKPAVVHNGRTAPGEPAPVAAPADFAFTAGRLWDEGKNLATLDEAAQRMKLPVVAAGSLDGPNGTRTEVAHLDALGGVDAPAVRERLGQRPVFVSTALYEPFGLGVLEAAQAGCALVLSDIASFRELWDGAALFAPPRDAEAFADAANRLADDPTLRARLGAAARSRASRYTVETMARRMMDIYAGLRAGRKGAAA